MMAPPAFPAPLPGAMPGPQMQMGQPPPASLVNPAAGMAKALSDLAAPTARDRTKDAIRSDVPRAAKLISSWLNAGKAPSSS